MTAANDGAELGDIISTRIAGWFDSPAAKNRATSTIAWSRRFERPAGRARTQARRRQPGSRGADARLNRNTLRKKITDHKIVLTKFPGG